MMYGQRPQMPNTNPGLRVPAVPTAPMAQNAQAFRPQPLAVPPAGQAPGQGIGPEMRSMIGEQLMANAGSGPVANPMQGMGNMAQTLAGANIVRQNQGQIRPEQSAGGQIDPRALMAIRRLMGFGRG